MVQIKREAEDDGPKSRNVRQKMTDVPGNGTDVVLSVVISRDKVTRQYEILPGLLKAHAGYFDRELKGKFTASFTTWDAEIFAMFVNFIQHGQIFSSKDDDATGSGPVIHDKEWQRLADAWRLGKALFSTSFQDAVSNAFYQKIGEGRSIPIGHLETLYSKTTPTSASGLRQLMIDIAAFKWSNETLKAAKTNGISYDFLLDISVEFQTMAQNKAFGNAFVEHSDAHPCRYHDHVMLGKPCWRTMFPK